MKKRAIGLLLMIAAVSVAAYRYNVIRAVEYSGSKVCRGVKDKIECNSDAAMIQEEYSECSKACPTRSEWQEYCSDSLFNCENDCELLSAEGKSAQEVQDCKNQCAKSAQECENLYRDTGQCEKDCTKAYKENMDQFDARWIKKINRG